MNGRAYYNENDTFAAQWLRNLIAAGHVAAGDVDERSIVDVRASDLDGYTQCHFFAGLGGWSGALRLVGWPDSRPVWTGSCPCQPFSLAGKQKGFADERHLWPVWRKLIQECRPSRVFGEQVASAAEWLRLVRSDLEAMDYSVGCAPVQAASAGAFHLRDRFWFVGDYQSERRGEGRPEHEIRGWRSTVAGDGGSVDSANAGSGRLCRSGQRQTQQPRGAETIGASDPGINVVDTLSERGCGGHGERQDATHADPSSEGRNMADAMLNGTRNAAASSDRPQGATIEIDGNALRACASVGIHCANHEWAIGSDGKARPVKSGICLLAHGVPARVAKLRALGNAIDLRPAAQFILASQEAIGDLT